MKKLILSAPELPNQSVELTPGQLPVVMGRSSHADVTIRDRLLSREHSRIRLTSDGEFEIVDLDSTNLTIVNERDVESHVLQTGDRILLGDTEIAVQVIVDDAADFNEQTTREITAVRDSDRKLPPD